jgi:putative membrane protein
MMDFGYGYMGGFGSIFMLLFWGLVIWGIISVARMGFGGGHGCGHSHGDSAQEKSPLDVLKERYAKGEIDKKEFEEKKKDLQ